MDTRCSYVIVKSVSLIPSLSKNYIIDDDKDLSFSRTILPLRSEPISDRFHFLTSLPTFSESTPNFSSLSPRQRILQLYLVHFRFHFQLLFFRD
ncbi:hypothetical protein RJT34_32578 [Clitoria ternatea]|uniref:Uncharacterized protein n=1 Tax=Clitoria ternatea TaxID=43366 RepID=A0AAN9EXQ7_CLITE